MRTFQQIILELQDYWDGQGCALLQPYDMEVIYCAIAFAGFSHLFDSRVVKATMELVSFLLMLFLGVKYLLAH